LFFFSSRRRHTRFSRDWSSDVCSSDLLLLAFLHLVTAFYHLSLFCIHRIIKRIQTAVAYKFHRSGNGEFQRQQVFPLIKRKLHKQAAFFDNRIVELPKERVIHFEIKMMTAVFQSCELYDELF